MAKTISKLSILLSLNSAGVSTGVGKASGALSKMAKVAGPVAGALAGIAGVGLTARAAMNSLAAAFSRVDESAKVADRLNLTIASLEALKTAAEDGGSSGQTLVMALQRMTRRISEAAQGSGEAKDALKELGLSADELSRLTADEQMLRIAKALQGVSNEGDKTRLMMRLFDSEGVALKNMLGDLARTGLDPLRERMRKLGVLSREDAAAVEEMNKSWLMFRKALEGVWNQVSAAVAPVLTDLLVNVLIPLAEKTIELVKWFRELFGADPRKIAGAGEEAALAAKTAAAETSRWAEQEKRLMEYAKATARLEKEKSAEKKKQLAAAKAELAALERAKATSAGAASTPTIGAVTRGTTAAVAAVQNLINAGRDRAAAEAAERRKLLDLAAKREHWLREIARLTASIERKPSGAIRVAAAGIL